MVNKVIKAIPFLVFALGFGTASSLVTPTSNEARDVNVIVLKEDGVTDATLINRITTATGNNFEIVKEFKGLGEGYMVNMSSSRLERMKSMQGVEAANVDSIIATHSANEMKEIPYGGYFDAEEVTNDSIAAMNVPADSKRGEGVLIAVLDSSFSCLHNAFADLAPETAKKLSESDVSTIKSSNIFSGKTGQYINSKIPFIYDYGGVISDSGIITDDNDPESVVSDHGMHVSSIAAANGAFEGIAKNAQLAFLKVFSETSSGGQTCYDSTMITALNDAYLLGADIVNMSIGSDLDENDHSAFDTVVNKFKSQGGIVAIAAGNSGKGDWANSGTYAYTTTDMVETGILGQLASTTNSTTVASSNLAVDDDIDTMFSVDNKLVELFDQVNITEGSETNPPVAKPITGLIPEGQTQVTLPYVVVPGLGNAADYNGIDVTGKIAMVKRGDLTFVEKIANAKAAGAIACIIYDMEDLIALGGFALSDATADGLIPTLKCPCEMRDTLLNAQVKELTIGKDLMSSYSSDGVTGSLRIKPDISAPGCSIAGATNVSTDETPVSVHDKYTYLDGTSMATPNFAGAAATVLSDGNGSEDFKKSLNARLMSNADPLVQTNGATFSVRRQGAGQVNVTRAESGMWITGSNGEAKVELLNNDDISAGKIKFTVTVHNDNGLTGAFDGKLNVTVPHTTLLDAKLYTLAAGTKLQTNKQTTIEEFSFDGELNGEATQEVQVEFEISAANKTILADIFENGVNLEGFLTISGTAIPTVNVPYLGFFGDYGSQMCVEPFDFEREEGKLYGSQVLNNLFVETGLKTYCPAANFESCIVYNKGGLNDFSMANIITNTADIKEEYSPCITRKIGDDWHVYAGVEGVADTICIQQFVNRTVVDNTITMKNALGETVLTDHMFDTIYGGDGDYRLFKSLATTGLIAGNSYYIAHRAYTIIPLADYAEGVYTIDMEYELMDGSKQYKHFCLDIIKSAANPDPTVDFVDGNIELTFPVEMNFVKFDDVAVEPTVSGDDVKYVIPTAGLATANSHHIYGVATNYGVANGLTFVNLGGILWSKEVLGSDKAKLVTKNITGGFTATVSVYDRKGVKKKLTADPLVTIFATGDYAGQEITVSGKSGTDYVDITDLIVGTNTVTFTAPAAGIKVVFGNGGEQSSSAGSASSEPTSAPTSGSSQGGDTPSTGGCGGTIVGSSMLVAAACLAAIGLIAKRRKGE